jgi:D-3-phosphoglycerate dehydrogenase
MFRVGITRDFLKPDGSYGFGGVGLDRFERAGIPWDILPENVVEIPPDVAQEYDGLLVLAPKVTERTVSPAGRLKIVARFGVGYDNIDVDACTRSGVILTITPEGVRRPVSVAAFTFLLALSHKLLIKDRLIRAGRWSEKLDHHGQGVTGRTLGIVGLGNIGQELALLVRPFDMHVVAHDPWVHPTTAERLGVTLLSLEDVLRRADYVCICCALTPQTHHLINAERLALMRPTSYLINVARGPIVDQAALTDCLRERRIAGAGLDVFEKEPIDPLDPLLSLDNVILSPHAICWTDECFGLNGRSAVASLIDVAENRCPKNVVNRDALLHERLRHLQCREDT